MESDPPRRLSLTILHTFQAIDLIHVLRTSPSIRPHLFSFQEFTSPFVLSEERQKKQFTEGGRSVGRSVELRGALKCRASIFVVLDYNDLQYSAPASHSKDTTGTNQSLCT